MKEEALKARSPDPSKKLCIKLENHVFAHRWIVGLTFVWTLTMGIIISFVDDGLVDGARWMGYVDLGLTFIQALFFYKITDYDMISAIAYSFGQTSYVSFHEFFELVSIIIVLYCFLSKFQ